MTREEALAALPADAAEPSDRELREWLWKSHGHGALYGDDGEMQCPECNPWDYKRAPLLAVVRAAFAAVRASTPTLTADSRVESLVDEVDEMREEAESYPTNSTMAEILFRYTNRFAAILAAKSQKGGDASCRTSSGIHQSKEPSLAISTDRASTEPVKANECDTPSAAWDRAMEKAAEEIDRELRWRTTEVDDTGRSLAPGFMRPLDELARIIRALRGKYEEFKGRA